MAIKKIHARQVYDSRGNPTVEVDVVTETGLYRATVPSGSTTDPHEACELRDGGNAHWAGKGVSKAVENVNVTIGPAIKEKKIDIKDQAAVDEFLRKLDGTKNKTALGANAITGVSIAIAKAGAAAKGMPLYAHIAELVGSKTPFVLPVPFMNILSGGPHVGGRVAFHDFMIVPCEATSFFEAVRHGTNVNHALRSLVIERYGQSAANVGDEGSVGPNLDSAEEALDLIMDAIRLSGHVQTKIAIHCAAIMFYKPETRKYDLDFKNPQSDEKQWLDHEQLAEYYRKLCTKYPIVAIADPFGDTHYEAWTEYARAANHQVIGDDLTITNPEYIKRAIDACAANAILLKVNQIGTLSESVVAAQTAFSAGWGVMVSHRFGDTEDHTIADLAVGLRTGQINCGAPCRSERNAKLNQLLRIEEELGASAVYAGPQFRSAWSL